MEDSRDEFEFKRDPDNGWLIGPDGCHYQSPADAFYYATFRLCGCGDPQAVSAFLVTALRHFRDDGERVHGLQKLVENEREAVAEFVAHYLDSCKLIDHGSSVYSAWLTPLGEQVLAAGVSDGGID